MSPEGSIDDFTLGEADYIGWLKFPQKLYGRDNQLGELVSAFDSACRGTSSIVFVSGYSGIGKTALVEEIQPTVSKNSGYFIQGKFDQLVTTPYVGINSGIGCIGFPDPDAKQNPARRMEVEDP